jgi:hypothetical protein
LVGKTKKIKIISGNSNTLFGEIINNFNHEGFAA